MEPIRKAALVNAAIAEMGRSGTLEVTVGQIARRAGMSAALAHHYFGSKEAMFIAAMRHVLGVYGAEVRAGLKASRDPATRLQAILEASFSPTNFRREVVGAWLTFYVLAQTVPEARRLLALYQRRLRSNLVHCLRPMAGAGAGVLAERVGAMIDGVYLREALKEGAPDARAAVDSVAALVTAACGAPALLAEEP